MAQELINLRATLVAVLDDGKGARPWQGLVRRANGDEVMVDARVAPAAAPGDDVILRGVLTQNALDAGLPARFSVGDPNPPQNRFIALLTGGASVRHYLGAAGREASPGIAAWLHGVRAGLVEAFTTPDTTVIPARGDDNHLPHFKFADQLLRSMPTRGPLVLLNPASFSPTHLVFGPVDESVPADPSAPVSQVARQRGRAMLANALPESLKGLADDAFADIAVRGRPGRNGLNAIGGAAWRSGRGAVVLPFDRYQSFAGFFAATTGLSPAAIAPRGHVDGRELQAFEMCRQIGHAIALESGIRSDGTPAGDNLQNGFADAFAIMAIAARAVAEKADSPFHGPQVIVDALRLAALNGPLAGATGAVAAEALATAVAADPSAPIDGELLMRQAARIARKHALSADTLADLDAARTRFALTQGTVAPIAALPAGLAAMADSPAKTELTEALRVLERAAIPGTALDNPDLAKWVAARYKADVLAVMSYTDRNDGTLESIMRRERAAIDGRADSPLGKIKAAVLHDLRYEKPVKPFPVRPAHNWTLSRTYRPRYQHDGLRMAFEAQPALALERWQNHLKTEVRLLEQFLEPSAVPLPEVERMDRWMRVVSTRMARLDNAFALVTRPECVAHVQAAAPALLTHLVEDAKAPLLDDNLKALGAELLRLRALEVEAAKPSALRPRTP